MSKDICYGSDAKLKILSGAEKLAKTVAVTMGPKGKNVILEMEHGSPVVTKDGVSVARQVVLKDPVEELGCKLVKEVAGRTADLAGDGTTTATVLAHEILKHGCSVIDSGAITPVDFRDGIEMAVDQVIANLEKSSKGASTFEDVKNIATISSNSDKLLGESIARAFSEVGFKGAVLAEASPGNKTSVRTVDGIEIDGGYVTDSLLVDGENYEAVLEDCCILISDEEISNINECLQLFHELSNNNKKVLIIAKSVKQEALATLVANRRLGRLDAMAISMPTYRGRYDKDAWFYDLSLMCGTTIVGSKKGKPLRNVTMDDLGYASKVIVGKYNTKIIGNRRNEEAAKNRAESYATDLNYNLDPRVRRDVEDRILSLGSKAAVVSVGYSTEAELKEVGDRVDDALSAVKAAIEEGLVAGGGIAILRAANDIDLKNVEKKYHPAFETVISACKRPITQICLNSGKDPESVVSKVLKSKSKTFGYNAATDEFGDLLEMGVVDPKKVTRLALKNASSVALLIINTEAVVSYPKGVEYNWEPPPGWRPPVDGRMVK
tara:strand:- start:426 stop:2075 length:1650 start_codon:yes stop_codon:yes gene_type:complete